MKDNSEEDTIEKYNETSDEKTESCGCFTEEPSESNEAEEMIQDSETEQTSKTNETEDTAEANETIQTKTNDTKNEEIELSKCTIKENGDVDCVTSQENLERIQQKRIKPKRLILEAKD